MEQQGLFHADAPGVLDVAEVMGIAPGDQALAMQPQTSLLRLLCRAVSPSAR